MPIVLDNLLKKTYNACGLRDIHLNGAGFGAVSFDLEDDFLGRGDAYKVVDMREIPRLASSSAF